MREVPDCILAADLMVQLVWLSAEPGGLRIVRIPGDRYVVELPQGLGAESCGGWGKSIAEATDNALRELKAKRRPRRRLEAVT